MLLDWDNPPELDAPRRRWTKQLNADRVKLVRLQQHRAKGPKNHATNKDRSHEARVKNRSIEQLLARRAEVVAAHHRAVRAFWAGEIDNYPSIIPLHDIR